MRLALRVTLLVIALPALIHRVVVALIREINDWQDEIADTWNEKPTA